MLSNQNVSQLYLVDLLCKTKESVVKPFHVQHKGLLRVAPAVDLCEAGELGEVGSGIPALGRDGQGVLRTNSADQRLPETIGVNDATQKAAAHAKEINLFGSWSRTQASCASGRSSEQEEGYQVRNGAPKHEPCDLCEKSATKMQHSKMPVPLFKGGPFLKRYLCRDT